MTGTCNACGQELPPVADELVCHYMLDGYQFKRLIGSPDEMVDQAVEVIKTHPRGPYGMLCPGIVLAGKKELRRVGDSIHIGKATEANIGIFRAAAIKHWRDMLLADPDVPRLIASVDRSPEGGNGEAGAIEDESAVPKAGAPNPSLPRSSDA